MKMKVWVYTWDTDEETDSEVYTSHGAALAAIMSAAIQYTELSDRVSDADIDHLSELLYNGADPAGIEERFLDLTGHYGFWGIDHHAVTEHEIDISEWLSSNWEQVEGWLYNT